MTTSSSLPSRGRRLWLLRLLALALVPVALLVVEAGLRLAGVGYPSAFLIPHPEAADTLTSNPRFGHRFFPRRLARPPVPFVLAPKAEGVYRVFVVGGSAARGTPDPAFGLPRVLETTLEASYPEGRFEVVNAAMTAVNSHVVLPVVRDVVKRGDADLIVVYLGNNEVVGPYGAASVLGGFAPRTGMLRAALVVRGWRLGQLIDGVVGADPPASGWRGMEMFLEQTIASTDPRLEQVYDSFATNLEDMVEASTRAGVSVVLSTVAVNLRDQPPFASLGADQDDTLAAELQAATEALEAGDAAASLARAEAAVASADGHAEAHYHRGQALHALQRFDEARSAFERARDLDALRFRADSRINELIREVAGKKRVPLVDAAEFFASGAGLGVPLPGHAVFLEHVHLGFQGNAQLAGLVLEQVAPLLPASFSAAPTELGAARIAELLPFTPDDALAIESAILDIVARPPFTATHGHLADLERRHRQRAALRRLTTSEQARARTEELYRRRLASHPADLEARRRLASILDQWGDAAGAAGMWAELVERLSEVVAWQRALGVALGRSGELDLGETRLRDALDRWPEQAAEILVDLGTLQEDAGRLDAAAESYRGAAAADPASPVPPFNLAMLRGRQGDFEAAADELRAVIESHPAFFLAHRNLGVALERLGRLEEAAAAYGREIETSPGRAAGHAHLGWVLERQGKEREALGSYARAVSLEPDHAPALFHLGDFLLARGRASEASAYYRQGLAVEPANVQARHNLAKALLQAGEAGQALEQLQLVAASRPRDPLLLADAASALVALDRLPEARAALETGLELARAAGGSELQEMLQQRLAEL